MEHKQALYREFRPGTFSEIFGQDAIVATLKRQIETGRVSHAYLFCGTRGTGKTSASKVFARALNCLNPMGGEPCGACEACNLIDNETTMDISEIDAASNNSVDEIRELRDKVSYPPTNLKYKVYIIDEVHMLSTGAFNALLKTLEEPPVHAIFILATTEPHKLPATVLSRCQRFDFKRISADVIVDKLMIVLGGIGRAAEENALKEIARAAEGSMRDAMSLTDVCLSYTDGVVTEELARDVLGSSGRKFMFGFMDALISNDAARALALIAEEMNGGRDALMFARECVSHARNALMARLVGKELAAIAELTEEDAARFIEQASRAPVGKLERIMDLFMHADRDMTYATQPRALLELSAVRACHPENERDASLDERLAKLENAIAQGIIAKPAPPKPEKSVEKIVENSVETPAEAAPQIVDPPNEYLDAIAKIIAENVPIRAAMKEMRFASIEGNVVHVEFPKKYVSYKSVLERKTAVFDAALTEAFARPMKIEMHDEGDAPAAKPLPARDIIAQSYEVFGRENIELTD